MNVNTKHETDKKIEILENALLVFAELGTNALLLTPLFLITMIW